MDGILYDLGGDDITREKTIDIDEDEKKTIVFEYFIPESISPGFYDLEIKYQYDAYDYNANTTRTYKHTKTFNVDVIKKVIDPMDVLTNLTSQLSEEKQKTNELLSTVLSTTNLTLKLDECRKELNDERIEGDYKVKYDTELTKSRDFENRVATCNTEKQNMYTQSQIEIKVGEAEAIAKREQKNHGDNWTLILVGGTVVFFMWQKKKSEVGGKGEGVSLKGATWK